MARGSFIQASSSWILLIRLVVDIMLEEPSLHPAHNLFTRLTCSVFKVCDGA